MTRILVVDDEPIVARSIVVQLRAMRIESVAVHSGVDALAALAGDGAFDLIISDCDMRPMSGPQLLEALETQGSTTPMLFLTGLATAEVTARVQASRLVRGIAQKPLIGAAFVETVTRALAGVDGDDELIG